MFGKNSGSKAAAKKPLDPAEKERIRRRQKIVVSSSLLFSFIYVALFWLNQAYCLPQELYHRVWKTTADNFYERDKLKDWGTWEHKYDDRIKNYADAQKYIGVMLKTLNDTFTTFYDARSTSRHNDAGEGFYSGVGMIMSSKTHPVVVRRVMHGSPAESAGVQPGDLILTMDGVDCRQTEPSKIGDHTRERMYKQVRFTFDRNGKSLELILVPQKIALQATVARILSGDIAYERIENFNRKNLEPIIEKDFQKLKGCRALILDLRGNGGGGVDLSLKILSSMMETGNLTSLRSRSTTPAGGDSFLTTSYSLGKDALIVQDSRDGVKKDTQRRERMTDYWDGKPIVVLVDKLTGSSAEMVAAAISENGRARLIGERTFGKGIAQIYFHMPMSTLVSVTAGRYFTPSGRWLGDGQEISDAERDLPANKNRGIEPQYVVAATKNLVYAESNDNQLQYAIDYLNRSHTQNDNFAPEDKKQ